VLGDDALIVGDELYNSYKEVCDLLNMKVNVTKTFRSTRLFEFAKRFFFERKEISAFPLGAVLSSNCDLSRIAVAFDNAKAKSWFGGKKWYEFSNVVILRKTLAGMVRHLWHQKNGPVDLSLVDRIVRLLYIFAIMRNVYRGPCDPEEIRKILPTSSRCTVGTETLVRRIKYLFQLSIKEKAESALSQAHLPVFMKRSEFMMKLMMSGRPAPVMKPGQSTP